MSAAAPAVVVQVDPPDLDLALVHHWLSTDAYWSLGRTRDQVDRAAAGSVNLVARIGDRPVGYARLVTDRALFAWLCDVYVDPAARGVGAGQALVARVVELTDGWGVTRTLLKTGDAHTLYAQHGFVGVDDPELWMVRPGGPR